MIQLVLSAQGIFKAGFYLFFILKTKRSHALA